MDDDKPKRKPPAFQFYAKDWRSSPTVRSMSLAEEGLYIRTLALFWDSETPGTFEGTEEQLAKLLSIRTKVLRKFLQKFPKVLRQVASTFTQIKLTEQYINYLDLSDKRKKAAESRYANAEQVHHSASASASASASKEVKEHTQAFVKPTYEQVLAEMLTRQIPNAQNLARQYVDHYEANGWKIGRNPMKSWKHAVTTWQVNHRNDGGNGNAKSKAEEREARSNRAIFEAGRKIAERDGLLSEDEGGIWDRDDGNPIGNLH